jgi:hypothetical protein
MSKSEDSGHDSDESRHNNAKTKLVIKNARPESEDSGADSKEPMHDLENTIPRKKI